MAPVERPGSSSGFGCVLERVRVRGGTSIERSSGRAGSETTPVIEQTDAVAKRNGQLLEIGAASDKGPAPTFC